MKLPHAIRNAPSPAAPGNTTAARLGVNAEFGFSPSASEHRHTRRASTTYTCGESATPCRTAAPRSTARLRAAAEVGPRAVANVILQVFSRTELGIRGMTPKRRALHRTNDPPELVDFRRSASGPQRMTWMAFVGPFVTRAQAAPLWRKRYKKRSGGEGRPSELI